MLQTTLTSLKQALRTTPLRLMVLAISIVLLTSFKAVSGLFEEKSNNQSLAH
jgi:hypothetical protein